MTKLVSTRQTSERQARLERSSAELSKAMKAIQSKIHTQRVTDRIDARRLITEAAYDLQCAAFEATLSRSEVEVNKVKKLREKLDLLSAENEKQLGLLAARRHSKSPIYLPTNEISSQVTSACASDLYSVVPFEKGVKTARGLLFTSALNSAGHIIPYYSLWVTPSFEFSSGFGSTPSNSWTKCSKNKLLAALLSRLSDDALLK